MSDTKLNEGNYFGTSGCENFNVKLSAKELEESVKELESIVCMLWEENFKLRNIKVKKAGRKEVLFNVLKKGDLWSVKELSVKMSKIVGVEISSRNISSLLTYIRNDIENGIIKGSLVRVGRGVGKLKFIKE